MPPPFSDRFFGGRSEILVTLFLLVTPRTWGAQFAPAREVSRTSIYRFVALKSEASNISLETFLVKVLQGFRTTFSKLDPKKTEFFWPKAAQFGHRNFFENFEFFVCWIFLEGVFFSVCWYVSVSPVCYFLGRYAVSGSELKCMRQPKSENGYI